MMSLLHPANKRPIPLTIDLCLSRQYIPIELCSLIKDFTHNWNGLHDDNIYQRLVDYYVYEEPEIKIEYGLLSYWDTSRVTDMVMLFDYAIEGNIIDEYDNTDMYNAFHDFNISLELWDVSNVTSMRGMFVHCHEFNQPLNTWNVSKVVDMTRMFASAYSFNQPLDNWKLDSLESMSSMFYDAHAFNQPIDMWNVSKVTNMDSAFHEATEFNQPLEKWDVSNVESMERMFSEAFAFNQPLNGWNISKVITFNNMFRNASSFNQPLDNWNLDEDRRTSMFVGESDCNEDTDSCQSYDDVFDYDI